MGFSFPAQIQEGQSMTEQAAQYTVTPRALPCIFCNGADVFFCTDYRHYSDSGTWVCCNGCGATAPVDLWNKSVIHPDATGIKLLPHHYGAIERAKADLKRFMDKLAADNDYDVMFPEADIQALDEIVAHIKQLEERVVPTLQQRITGLERAVPKWHYPRDNADIENMPPPDTFVVAHYRREDGSESNPVILHFTCDVKEIASMYRPITRWCAIPEG